MQEVYAAAPVQATVSQHATPSLQCFIALQATVVGPADLEEHIQPPQREGKVYGINQWTIGCLRCERIGLRADETVSTLAIRQHQWL